MQAGRDENRQEGEDHLDERGEPQEEKEIIPGKEEEGEMGYWNHGMRKWSPSA